MKKSTLPEFKRLFESHIKELQKKERILEKIVSGRSDDILNVIHDGERVKYYRRENGSSNRVYINSKQLDEIKNLEENEYYRKLKKAIEKERITFQRLEKQLKAIKEPSGIFLSIPKEKRHLICEFEEWNFDEDIVNEIKLDSKKSRVTDSKYITINGEKVRSKSELIIADRFQSYGLLYCYEPATFISAGNQIWHPDFKVINKRTGAIFYWEHFGMLDNNSYCDDFQYKLEQYADSGFYLGENLIMTTESSTRPISTALIDNLIKHYLL